MVYRVKLYGGPLDGDTFVVANPWEEAVMDGRHRYEAVGDGDGPVLYPDDGEAVVQAIHADGSVTEPPVVVIKMNWVGSKGR